jgi:hypothetical protein
MARRFFEKIKEWICASKLDLRVEDDGTRPAVSEDSPGITEV